MTKRIFFAFLLTSLVGLAQDEEYDKGDPMPLFLNFLKHSINGGKLEEIAKLEGVSKSVSKTDGVTYLLAKDPKYRGVTYWAKVSKGRITEFHLAIHRPDFNTKVKDAVEKAWGFKFKESKWQKSNIGTGKRKTLIKKGKKLQVKVQFTDMKIGDDDASSVVVHLQPTK